MEKLWFPNRMKDLRQDQQGMVLVFSIMVLTMIAMWGAATLTLSTNDYHIAHSSTKAIQAYYLAEAGLEEGIAKLRKNDIFVEFTGNLETGSYVVSGTGSIPGIITITSIGTVDDFQKTITGQLEITVSGGPPTYDEAEYRSQGDLTLGSGKRIDGDIYAGGSLTVGSNNDIDGHIYAGGNADFNSNNNINGDIFVDGNLVFNTNTIITGDIYVSGDLIFHNNTEIIGNIYLMGDLKYHQHFSIIGNIFYNWDGTYTASEYHLKLKELK